MFVFNMIPTYTVDLKSRSALAEAFAAAEQGYKVTSDNPAQRAFLDKLFK